MRTLPILVVLAALAAAACSESPSTKGPKESSGLSSGMSDDIWKAYSGTESGVTDAGKDPAGEKK